MFKSKNMVIFFFTAFLVVAGLGPEAKAAQKAPIKIAISGWPGWAHAYVAQEKGLFKKYGVEVELLFKNEYTDHMALYKDGDADGTFTLLPDVIMMNSTGIPTKIVYVVDYSKTSDVIIGRAEFNGLPDLKGKKVSFEGFNTFSHLFVLESLKRAGVDEEDVYFDNVPVNTIVGALDSGRIDAGHAWEPYKSEALRKGYKVLAKAEDVPGIIIDVLAFHSKVVEDRPKDVAGIVKALLEARAYLYSDNKAEAIKIMAEKEGTTVQDISSGLAGMEQPDREANIEAMKKSDSPASLYGASEIITEFFMERGQLLTVPNLDEIIDSQFLN